MSDIKCVDDVELDNMIKDGKKIVDIRTDIEWKNTGTIEHSHKLTFFDQFGSYDIESWLNKFQNIVRNKSESFVFGSVQ